LLGKQGRTGGQLNIMYQASAYVEFERGALKKDGTIFWINIAVRLA